MFEKQTDLCGCCRFTAAAPSPRPERQKPSTQEVGHAEEGSEKVQAAHLQHRK